MDNKKIVPIFFACDNAYYKFTMVTMKSIILNANKDYFYKFYVLNDGIDQRNRDLAATMLTDYCSVEYPDCTPYFEKIKDKLPIRDYYNKTTYFRLFISEMYPEYDKAIYIDSDTVVKGDMSELFSYELGNNLVGAANEEAMIDRNLPFGTYVEKNLGLDRDHYFNAGLLVINCKLFREECVLDQFINLLNVYECKVTQDEDYLNIICKDRVLWIDRAWNTETLGEIHYDENTFKMAHFIMWGKPWKVTDVRFFDYYWEIVRQTPVHDEIKTILDNYTEEQRALDKKGLESLSQLAVDEIKRDDTFVAQKEKLGIKSVDRLKVLKKIEEYEKKGIFDQDVEEDPEGKELLPDQVDYLKKKKSSRVKTKIAYFLARLYLNKIMKQEDMIIKEVKGIEHLQNLESGAIMTCNHFNALDSFAIQVAYEEAIKKKDRKRRKFYRVIREGNYTSFEGFYGFLMRNCYTLPLSSNTKTMQKFMRSMNQLLENGNLVLVYPEQSMWWNYRKPKPLKKGAFQFAVRANVPVVPCFITMEDTNKLDPNGFKVQEYTIHISAPIYPKPEYNNIENVKYLMDENYRVWKEIYESVYHIPLEYTTVEQIAN